MARKTTPNPPLPTSSRRVNLPRSLRQFGQASTDPDVVSRGWLGSRKATSQGGIGRQLGNMPKVCVAGDHLSGFPAQFDVGQDQLDEDRPPVQFRVRGQELRFQASPRANTLFQSGR